MSKAVARTFLSVLSRSLRPAAWARARRGYFSRHDLRALQADRVALIACHWIGDTFWATQVTDALRERFAGAEFFAITKPLCADLWHGRIPNDRVLPAAEVISDRMREKTGLGAIRRRTAALREHHFDLAIDLTGNRYSAYFTFMLRPRVSLGFDGGELGWLYSQRVAGADRPGRHLSERPFRVIEPLLAGSKHPFAYALPLKPPVPTLTTEAAARRAGIPGRRYFILAPGAGWPAKQWPPNRFGALGQELAARGTAVVVIGSADQRDLCLRVAQAVPGAVLFIGQPIGEVVSLLDGAAGVACNDSGIGHLAAALGRRTAAIFTAATDPAVCAPIGTGDCARTFSADADITEIANFLS
ncbi:MAG: glycosyltransferase family 9 protein [Phycisphaerae bacterium]|nr:glycosyltransferase family 9 protein [Phycisphaerae bacterium]MDP7636491.1 glycosyltransferase family 9 protein [Phycisphaerae bacterium]